MGTALLIGPDGGKAPGPGFCPATPAQPAEGEGWLFAPVEGAGSGETLTAGDRGVTYRSRDGVPVTIEWERCAAAERRPDGSLMLHAHDGGWLTITPSHWERGDVAARADLAALDPHLRPPGGRRRGRRADRVPCRGEAGGAAAGRARAGDPDVGAESGGAADRPRRGRLREGSRPAGAHRPARAVADGERRARAAARRDRPRQAPGVEAAGGAAGHRRQGRDAVDRDRPKGPRTRDRRRDRAPRGVSRPVRSIMLIGHAAVQARLRLLADRRSAEGDRRHRRGRRGGRALHDAAGRHRHRQDDDDGGDDRAVQRPALILAHNKTLAAQLCNEFRTYFPCNSVEYFVSYYDYYQPEAYVPSGTSTSRRTRRSTRRSTGCATPRRRRCSRAATS